MNWKQLAPSIKLVGAAVVAGLVMVARTENLDWRSAFLSFVAGAGPALGVGYGIPDLNPSPSARRRIAKENEDLLLE